MTQSNDPIIIIGTGLAGYNLAKELRKLDKETPITMITADDGRNYSKPMLSTGFGKNKTADELAMSSAADMAAQLNLTIRTHTHVTALRPDAHEIDLGPETLSYSKLVLAWGAEAIRVPVEGISFRSRSAGGVKVFSTGKNEEVVSVAWIADQGNEEDEAEGDSAAE